MKVAVSIPDAVFEEADALARRLKKSRSQLYAEAVAGYLRRHDDGAVTVALNEVMGDLAEVGSDGLVSEAATKTLADIEW